MNVDSSSVLSQFLHRREFTTVSTYKCLPRFNEQLKSQPASAYNDCLAEALLAFTYHSPPFYSVLCL